MALSGSVTTGEYSQRSVTLSWTATQDIANNKSTIKWTLKGSGSYSGWVRVSEVRIKLMAVRYFIAIPAITRMHIMVHKYVVAPKH